MQARFLLVLLAVAVAVTALPVAELDQEDVVVTTAGPIRGILLEKSRSFKGVRYANKLDPSLRWTAPKRPEPWTEIYNATEFGAGCPQDCKLPPLTCPDKLSEDCLFLNVYTPRLSAPKPANGWPVMAFIHGGRFEQGAAGGILYEGGPIAEEGVVMVSMNYRLNLFGFLATGDGLLDGNHGFKDQILALQWIQENIKQFGGNPDQVTLSGQSAGGTSIAAHLASPNSTNLFHRAIIQSNPWSMRIREDDAQDFGDQFISKAGCPKKDYLDCLRSKSIEELLSAVEKIKVFPEPHPLNLVYRWTPVVDGSLILDQPMLLLKSKQFRSVPLMIGSTLDDGRMFIYELSEKPVNKAMFRLANFAIWGDHVLRILSQYPDTNKTDARGIMCDETTHSIFACPNRWAADQLAQINPQNKLYLYQFNHALSWDAWGPRYPFCDGYACHAAELAFVFSTAQNFYNPEEFSLADSCRKYWTSFAKSDDASPNYSGGVEWPSYTSTARESIMLDLKVTKTANLLKDRCDFWDSIDWYQNQ